jgi:hypothetical protein
MITVVKRNKRAKPDPEQLKLADSLLENCVFRRNWTLVPPQTGHSFQRKLEVSVSESFRLPTIHLFTCILSTVLLTFPNEEFDRDQMTKRGTLGNSLPRRPVASEDEQTWMDKENAACNFRDERAQETLPAVAQAVLDEHGAKHSICLSGLGQYESSLSIFFQRPRQ